MGLFDFLGDVGSNISSGWQNLIGSVAPSTTYTAPDIYTGPSSAVAPDASLGNFETNTNFFPAATPTPQTGGWGNVLNTVGGVAKDVLPFAQIGGAALGGVTAFQAGQEASKQNDIALRAQKQREQLTNQAAAGAATPLTNFGQSQIDAATKGQVPDAIRAQIDQWKQAALAQVRDYLARAGIGDSEARLQWEQYIDKQAQAMEAQALQSEQQTGISALGTGGSVLTNAAGQAGQVAGQAGANVNSIDSLIASANQQLARLSAGAAA